MNVLISVALLFLILVAHFHLSLTLQVCSNCIFWLWSRILIHHCGWEIGPIIAFEFGRELLLVGNASYLVAWCLSTSFAHPLSSFSLRNWFHCFFWFPSPICFCHGCDRFDRNAVFKCGSLSSIAIYAFTSVKLLFRLQLHCFFWLWSSIVFCCCCLNFFRISVLYIARAFLFVMQASTLLASVFDYCGAKTLVIRTSTSVLLLLRNRLRIICRHSLLDLDSILVWYVSRASSSVVESSPLAALFFFACKSPFITVIDTPNLIVRMFLTSLAYTLPPCTLRLPSHFWFWSSVAMVHLTSIPHSFVVEASTSSSLQFWTLIMHILFSSTLCLWSHGCFCHLLRILFDH